MLPGYLVQRNEEMKRAQEEYDEFVREHMRRGQMEQLSEEERISVINGLKANWERIHREFQVR